jgi:hypothetical protein
MCNKQTNKQTLVVVGEEVGQRQPQQQSRVLVDRIKLNDLQRRKRHGELGHLKGGNGHRAEQENKRKKKEKKKCSSAKGSQMNGHMTKFDDQDARNNRNLPGGPVTLPDV